MQRIDFRFSFETNTIAGTTYLADGGAKPMVLSLHGAGASTRRRSDYLLSELADAGLSSVTLDFSGHGDSSGAMVDSSLQLRCLQALEACRQVEAEVKVILGSSMGAHVASTLIPALNPIGGVVLFCPAAYAREAQEVPFDERFTSILRTPGSFRSSLAYRCINEFDGPVAIFIGADDKVIPAEVVDGYEKAARPGTMSVTKFSGVGHQLHAWLESNQDDRRRVLEVIRKMAVS